MHKKRAVLITVSLCIICFFAITLYVWANQNVVVTSYTTNNVITPSSPSQTSQINDKYFNAVVPAGYTINSKSAVPEGNMLSRYVLKNIDPKSLDQLAITIGTLPSEGLTGLSDVMFRAKNTQYVPYNSIKIADKSVEFIAENPFELSVFWSHGNRYAAVVISGTQDRGEVLKKVINDLIGKWSWID